MFSMERVATISTTLLSSLTLRTDDGQREGDDKCAPPPYLALDPNRPALRFNQRLGDRQAQAAARAASRWIAAPETLENVRQEC